LGFLLFASGFLNVFPRNVVAFIENFNDLRGQVKEFTGNNGNLAQEIKGGRLRLLKLAGP